MTLHETAAALKTKTDAGAVLVFDGELWANPIWRITDKEISFANSGCRIILWDKAGEWGTTKAEAMRVIKKRIRVLVDA